MPDAAVPWLPLFRCSVLGLTSCDRCGERRLPLLKLLRVVVAAICASAGGAALGFGLGVAVGLGYTHLVRVSQLEGYEGMLVLITFGGGGAILGAVAGALAVLVGAWRSTRRQVSGARWRT